ncbi:hypothetical protein K469DRAFT_715913 [Zopfia rhizophila CBS 207.26]|uniref:F-box domain-containing protein n=1 Tax=Zopfia rhizophila CBS 207.26 TaxID=1314779 RepID=A0A6A6DNJ5_9PEZI|nr:hypothetical protein K469DRAFT_715913 [Zopfia rhizophila CBS 207.26]
MKNPPRISRFTLSDLNDDVLRDICDHLIIWAQSQPTGSCAKKRAPLKALSLVDRRLRALVAPQIFKKVIISGSGGRSQCLPNGDWKTAHRALSDLSNNPTIITYIKSLRFDIYGSEAPNRPAFSQDMHQFVAFLCKLPSLQRLVIYIPKPHVDGFQSAFRHIDTDSPFLFPNIKTLVFHPFTLSLLDRCPNVEEVCMHVPHWSRGFNRESPETMEAFRRELVATAKRAKKATHFDASGHWSVEHITDLVKAAPQLERLNMRGHARHYDGAFYEIMQALGSFEGLRRLDVEDASELGLGFKGGHMCGNAYFGPDGERLHRQLKKDREDAEETAAKLAFQNIASLRELWVGDYAKAERKEGYTAWTWRRSWDLVKDQIEK